MHDFISVKVVSLQDLFSDAYHFRLPYFQRAYAWQTPAVGRLLSDVTEAMSQDATRPFYYLGKLMLAKAPDAPDTALVDGHQRVMSLTLLFAVLRDLEADAAVKAKLQSFIAGTTLRLSPQEMIRGFLNDFVQAPRATEVEPEDDLADLSETERNIIENRNHLRGELMSAEYDAETRRTLSDFLATRCCVTTLSVEDEEEAWRFLRIEEDTRVDFNPSDRAKASLLSIVQPGERAECQKIWETCEALLGADDMHALLGHLRTLKLRKRSEKPLEVDIAQGFKLNVAGRGAAFFAQELRPAAELLAEMRRPSPGDRSAASAVADSFDRMSWMNTQVWVPAALLWRRTARSAAESSLFFKRLERLVWIMRIAYPDPSKQQNRIVRLLGEIDRGLKVEAMQELEIPKKMRDEALTNLRSRRFDAKHYCARILRRISIALKQDPGPVDAETLTIEHILPSGAVANSGWRKHFPSKHVVDNHVHRLGNLTFLTAAENQAAGTLDWVDKRPILARSKLILANRLGATADWTPQSITSRTEDMIRILFECWDLKP